MKRGDEWKNLRELLELLLKSGARVNSDDLDSCTSWMAVDLRTLRRSGFCLDGANVTAANYYGAGPSAFYPRPAFAATGGAGAVLAAPGPP